MKYCIQVVIQPAYLTRRRLITEPPNGNYIFLKSTYTSRIRETISNLQIPLAKN